MKSPAEMNKEDLTRSPRPKKKRILVVEDQDYKHNLLRLALGEYDLYILDNQIPGGTGIELCRRIREFDPNTPILFCSGSADSSEALGAGAQAYFAKPIEVQEVLWAVTELLSTSSQRLSEARHAEYVAIREELARRFSEISQSMEMAAEQKQRALRKLLRLKAKKAFLDAGGMRGDFARLWPATYLDAALNWECAKRERAAND